MKTLVVAILAAATSLAPLSSAQAITAAPLTETAKQISPVVEVQMNSVGGCTRGYAMTPTGCREQTFGFKKSTRKGTKPRAKK
jgi:hypothetical protein